ncbi:hypothetical protein EDC94DRAFT_648773 [Helicostylum pulchrum]|nr:hypothetical protein EDC94DRAFT_648773 [Helicostylum pulchrum]
MDEVYDLHQHTHGVVFFIKYNTVFHQMYYYSTRNNTGGSLLSQEGDSYITYDKQKSKVLSWGKKCDKEDEDTVQIDISGRRLYRLFKKDKGSWNQDDLFSFKAVSDYISLSVGRLLGKENKRLKQVNDTDALHYVFVVPSEWEEEIKEVLIRPIFVRANLISKDDHQDRLLFCTDIESIYYYIARYRRDNCKLTRNTIIGVIDVVEESKVSIQLNSMLIVNSLFDLSNSLLFPKLVASDSSFLTTNDVKNGIRNFIKIKFSFDAQEDTIKNIMEEIHPDSPYKLWDEDKLSCLNKPFITDKSISELDKKREALIKSIRPIDICAEISKHLPNNLKRLLPNNLMQEYSLLRLLANGWSYKVDKGLLYWAGILFEYNRIFFGSNNVIHKRLGIATFDNKSVLVGAARYMFNALHNSDIYSKPRILYTEDSATSSSIFLKSKPDAILNIDISLESTMLSFSLLDENGLVKQMWGHDDFVPDTRLRALGSFFSFSDVTTLNIKNLFIVFVDEYFMNDPNLFFNEEYDVFHKYMVAEIEDILSLERQNKDALASTQQQVYIKSFVSIYLIYINYILSRKLPEITANSILLKRLFGTEDDLRDIIYASNLVQKDDSSKKLRIAIQGESLFPVIQQSFNLQFPVKSFFVTTQLYEYYVQLTLNQVVTESDLENEYQEAIIIQEEIIRIPNIYDTLCFNMWSNIIEDGSLIQLCDTHKAHDDDELLEIFTLENRAEFTKKLTGYISKNILNKMSNEQKTDTTSIHLSTSCNCRVCLTVNDITEISFRPVLQDIISLIFTSLINKQLFEKYRNIQYVFHLIRFNYNPQFQCILMKILEDETDHFLYEERIDVAHYTLPKLLNQLLQPALRKEPFSYRAFKVGVLYHVYSENYGFGFDTEGGDISYIFKNKIDSKIISINEETAFPLFKKGNRIKSTQIKRLFYLSSKTTMESLDTRLFRLKKADTLSFDETVHAEDMSENVRGPYCSVFDRRNIPFIISILYKGHSSSISLAVKSVGGEIEKEYCVVLAEPMTLACF